LPPVALSAPALSTLLCLSALGMKGNPRMLVRQTSIPPAEAKAFERAIRASGRDPAAFRAQMFEAAGNVDAVMRRVHVVTRHAAAQYDASEGVGWTQTFARHLALGFFGG
jgi:hypothetical protein